MCQWISIWSFCLISWTACFSSNIGLYFLILHMYRRKSKCCRFVSSIGFNSMWNFFNSFHILLIRQDLWNWNHFALLKLLVRRVHGLSCWKPLWLCWWLAKVMIASCDVLRRLLLFSWRTALLLFSISVIIENLLENIL